MFSTIYRLRATGIKIKFVTNTTEFSMRILHEHLTRLGFDIKKDEIYSAISASKDLVIKRSLRPYLMVDPNAIEEFAGNLVKYNFIPKCIPEICYGLFLCATFIVSTDIYVYFHSTSCKCWIRCIYFCIGTGVCKYIIWRGHWWGKWSWFNF